MTRLLAHPMRLVGTAMATVDPDQADGLSQEVAVLALTQPGERVMMPNFGVPDPAFLTVDTAAINAQLMLHGPAVKVAGVTSQVVDGLTQYVTLNLVDTPQVTP